MFDRYMIVENSLANWKEGKKTAGFQLDIHYPHHCGIWLSIIEQIALKVDGTAVPSRDMKLVLDEKAYPVEELARELHDRWYFGQAGKLRVSLPGGLKSGEHHLALKIALRVSFLNWLLIGEDTKTMTIKGEEKQ